MALGGLMKLTCEKRSYSNRMDTHDHNYGQLIFPMKGELSIRTVNNDVELNRNQLFYLPPECTHSFYSKNDNSFLVVDIHSGFRMSEQIKNLDSRWQSIKYLITEESKRQNHRGLESLLGYAMDCLSEDVKYESIEYIHKNYHEEISVEKLASLENYHPNHYIKWFRNKTGHTPNEYIQRVRFEKAKSFLINTEYDLLMIAGLVGYEHQSSLTRMFQKYATMTPNHYRKLMRTKYS